MGRSQALSFLQSAPYASPEKVTALEELSLPPSFVKGSRGGETTTLPNSGMKWLKRLLPIPDLPQDPRPLLTSNAAYKEGLYGKAIRALESSGVASPDDPIALEDLIKRHPKSAPPVAIPDLPSSLVISPDQVRASLQSFPKGSSPGFSQLRIQHLWDTICSCTVQVSPLISSRGQ